MYTCLATYIIYSFFLDSDFKSLVANEVARLIFEDIKDNCDIKTIIKDCVKEMLSQPNILRDSNKIVKEYASSSTKKLDNDSNGRSQTLVKLSEDSSLRPILLECLHYVISHPDTIQEFKDILSDFFNNAENKQMIAQYLLDLLQCDNVVEEVASVSKSVSHELLNDSDLQIEASNALWKTFKMSFASKFGLNK